MTKIERELKKCIADPEYFRKHYYVLLYPEDIDPIELRQNKFMSDLLDSIQGFFDVQHKDINDFFKYWTLKGKRSLLMKFEKEDTFDMASRFRTWLSNKKKFATVNLLRKTGFAIR